jgi:hypothetical protein
MASLGMTILMISFTTLLVGYSVSPMRFTKSNFREVQMQTVSNFRRALAISLAEVSQQLEFKARVRQYSMYLDLDTYPQARNLGYDLLSRWQNLTMLSYPGTGLNLTASIPAFSCSWNSTSGISTANANMMLDILNYGFFGFKESSVASLNLTLLDLSQIGSVTSFFFSLKAENDRPVPDLSDSSIHILYQKTNGGWNSSDPASTKVYYLGQGVYQARFNVNASQTYIPPHIRLIVQDSRGIVVGARAILSLSNQTDTVGPITSNVFATPNPSNSAPLVTVTATISDLFTGWSNILRAECIVNDSSGSTVFQGDMIAIDGAFNEISEDVRTNINVTGWSLGNYTVYVRGQDVRGNLGLFNSTVLRITPAPKMHVENIDMSLDTEKKSGWGRSRAIAVVTILDENGSPVGNANVTALWNITYQPPGNPRIVAEVTIGWSLTNDLGIATLISGWRNHSKWWPVTFTITVEDVERTGYVYDPTANKETTDSISIA